MVTREGWIVGMTWNIVVFEFFSAFCLGLHDHVAKDGWFTARSEDKCHTCYRLLVPLARDPRERSV